MPKALTRPPRVDWFRVIVELERAGHSSRRVAELLGMSQSWVEHLKNSPGAEPRYDDGMVLLDLWGGAVDKPSSEAPRELPHIYG